MLYNDFFALTSTETEIISTTCPFSFKISRERSRGRGGNTPATNTTSPPATNTTSPPPPAPTSSFPDLHFLLICGSTISSLQGLLGHFIFFILSFTIFAFNCLRGLINFLIILHELLFLQNLFCTSHPNNFY